MPKHKEGDDDETGRRMARMSQMRFEKEMHGSMIEQPTPHHVTKKEKEKKEKAKKEKEKKEKAKKDKNEKGKGNKRKVEKRKESDEKGSSQEENSEEIEVIIDDGGDSVSN